MKKILIHHALKLYLEQHPEINESDLLQIFEKIERYRKKWKRYQYDKPLLLHKINEVIEKGMEEASTEFDFSCKKGCSFCCHINVTITDTEATALIDYADQNDIQIDFNYLKQQATLSDYERTQSNTHSACIFLKEGICSVYDSRPIACRKYFVLSPAFRCDAKKFPAPYFKVGTYFDMDIELQLVGAYELLGPPGVMAAKLMKQLV